MTLIGFRSKNHPQQVAKRGVDTGTDLRATDPAFFALLHERFGFTVDACAIADNTKLPRYWTPEQNGLVQHWVGERVWCNPPYSDIGPWVVKAWTGGAELVVMILPANRTEQTWWQHLVEPHRDRVTAHNDMTLTVEFLPGRLRFIRHGATAIGPNERPPFGCCLLIFRKTGAAQ